MEKRVHITAVFDDNKPKGYHVTVNGHCVTATIREKAELELCRVLGFACAEHDLILTVGPRETRMERGAG